MRTLIEQQWEAMSPPAIVGREAELRALVEALKRPGSIAELVAQVGMGKTTLLKKLASDNAATFDGAIEYFSGNARDLIKPLLSIMLEHFAPIIWPPFDNAIVRDRATAWRIEHVLGGRFSFPDKKQPAVLHVPEDLLFGWAHANPDAGPALLARVLPVLTTRTKGAEFHPLMKRLLDEFDERDEVHSYLVQNMHSFGWMGSLTTYYALYEEPLRFLFEHPIGAVRRWAQVTHAHMRKQVEAARHDDEQDAQWNA